MEADQENSKVVFRYWSNVLDEDVVETMWAKPVDRELGVYKLDSIPFYGPSIASGDEFFAEQDKLEQRLVFREVIRESGNSVIIVVMLNKSHDKEQLRDELRKLHCESESISSTMFSLEILKSTDYKQIKEKLGLMEEAGVISYCEPCLSTKHQAEIEN